MPIYNYQDGCDSFQIINEESVNGIQQYELMLRNGKMVNLKICYSSGQIMNETWMDDGRVICYKFYAEKDPQESHVSSLDFEISLDDNDILKKYKLYDLETQKLTYEGECKNYKKSGYGRQFDQDGTILYQGNFFNDQKHGDGFSYYKDGNVLYRGQYVKDRLNGMGSFYHENGNIKCEGFWNNDKLSGSGKHFHMNGNLNMDGFFSKNYFKGIFYDIDRVKKYEGDMVKDLTYGNYIKEGKGKSFFDNGLVEYDGEWQTNKFSGIGQLYYIDGKLKYNGGFEDNKYCDLGMKYDLCENLMCIGIWKNGCLESIQLTHDHQIKGYKVLTDKENIYVGDVESGSISSYAEIYRRSNGLRYYEGFRSDDKSKEGVRKKYHDSVDTHQQSLRLIGTKIGNSMHGYSYEYHANGKFKRRVIFNDNQMILNKFRIEHFPNGTIDFDKSFKGRLYLMQEFKREHR